jgi:hypothetical protein
MIRMLACIRISYAYQASIRMIRMLACIRISYAYQASIKCVEKALKRMRP